MIEQDPDAHLLARIGQGDQRAIREMVARKLPRILALAARMLNDRGEAEDVAQETFIRIWKHAAQWQPDGARFDTWIHRVALNLCYDRLRTRADYSDEEIPDTVDPAAQADGRLMARQQQLEINDALAALPVRQREAIVLQYYQEMSNIDAASLMGISVDALESLLSRARRNMRNALLQQGYP